MTRPEEVSMHPKMMIALGREVENDRERKQIVRRSLVLQRRRTDATNSTTGIAGHEFVRRLLVVPRLLTRLS